TAKAGLGVQTLVVGPRLEVPTGNANYCATQAEPSDDGWLIDAVAESKLAPLDEARILDELRLRVAGGAAGAGEPCLPLCKCAERGQTSARTRDIRIDRGFEILSEDPRLRADVGVLVFAEAIERAARAVPHLAAVTDVEERRELDL